MRRALLVACLALGACGRLPAPEMRVGATCASGDLTLQIEAGIESPDLALYCEQVLVVLEKYRAAYEERFGHVDLAGWTVRLRAAGDLRETGAPDRGWSLGGYTYDGTVDLARYDFIVFAHELEHVRTGSGHAFNPWCTEYNPWSVEVLGWDQSDYLGCHASH